MNSAQYANRVFQRLSKGNPQGEVKILRSAIENQLPQALQRLADEVAANSKERVRLQSLFPLTLGGAGTAGEEPLPSTVVTNKSAIEGWYVRMSGVPNELQYLPNRRDLDNPLSALDYYYYTLFNGALVVRDANGNIPAETALSLYANYTPTISQVPAELEDNLINCGVQVALELGPQQVTVPQ